MNILQEILIDDLKYKKIAKKNGCDFVINYSKEDFAKKVLKFTKGEGVPAVYDGVGKKTLEGSIKCLKKRGIMISFGNASGPITNIDIKKMIQPKGLYFTRPSMAQYLETKDEIKEGADKLFEKLKVGLKRKQHTPKTYEVEFYPIYFLFHAL